MNLEKNLYQPMQEETKKVEEIITEKESLFQRLETMGKLRISEADAMAEDMIRVSKSNEEMLFEMVLKSPDLVTYFLFQKLDGKKIGVLVKKMSEKLENLSQKLHGYEEKYYKNHNPISFESCNLSLRELDSSLRLSQDIDNVENQSEKISLLDQIAGDIKLANGTISELKREEKFIERIVEDIESKKPYYHVSSIESDILNNNDDYTIYPGIANTWEEGVYVSERPLLHYLGGEGIKKEMNSCVIFVLPVDEDFIFNQGSATGKITDLINANTNKRCVRFKNILKSKLSKEDLLRMGAIGAERIDLNIPIYLITAEEISMDSNYQEEREKIFG